MGIKFVIALTDKNWFEMLRRRPDLDEVNFWRPSATNFQALQPGELILFKLRAPHNVIVGGGVFSYSKLLTCSQAWGSFDIANGARSLQEMRTNIVKLQTQEPNDKNDFEICCRFLTEPFFFEESDWIRQPASWASNLVLKTYNTNDVEGLQVLEDVKNRLKRQPQNELLEEVARYGKLQSTRPRLGQKGFRMLITEIYEWRCAVTQERTLPALEAAHIHSYRHGGKHEVQNGLLLRCNIHKLFDKGYVTITPDLNFKVSEQIQKEFGNGSHYYDLDGKRINAPKSLAERPDPVALTWHNKNCFKG